MSQTIPNDVGFVINCYSDGSGNPIPITAGTPLPITTDAIPGSVTRQKGQVKIATTGTAVQLSATSYVLQNGVIITAGGSNAAITYTSGGTGGTIGASNVTNTTDGTGNGAIISPGSSLSEGSGVNINTIYVNGVAGDIFSFLGS